MILFALTLFLIVIFFYNLKLFPFALVLFFAFFDMFDGFYKDDKIYAGIRYFVPLALVAFYMIRYEVLKTSDSILLVLILYLLLFWIINSGDFLITTRNVLAVILTVVMIPIGKHLGKSVNFIKEFEFYNRILLVAIPLYIIAANIMNFGESYTEVFSTGFYVTSRMYLVPIVVFLGIHYAITNQNKSWLIKANDILFILLNVCILIINTRRTTLGMLFFAILVYTLLNRKLILKMALLLIFAVAALIFSFPLYESKLMAQLEKRERIKNLDTYEEEGRYLETMYIMDYFETRGKPADYLFGVKLFDTQAFGITYFGRDRPIHSDINMLFYSTGIVGCLIFALLFIHYFFLGRSRITKYNRRLYYPLLIMFLIVLIPGRFIGTLTFAPLLMLLLSAIKYGKEETDTVEHDKQEASAMVLK